MIRVAICDDHSVVREGFRDLIDHSNDMTMSAEGSNGREALEIARKLQCEVMLLDINMPGQNGVDVLRAIKQTQPDFRVVMLSTCPAEQFALSVMKMGADGYLEKTCDIDEIPAAIRTVAAGRRHLGATVGDLLAKNFCQPSVESAHATLSDREFQVFLRLCKGEAVTDMAENLCLSVKTISTYRSRVLEKMGMHSNSELTYYAVKHDLID